MASEKEVVHELLVSKEAFAIIAEAIKWLTIERLKFQRLSLSYSRRSVSGPLWAFAAAGCIARTTGIAGVCFTAFGLMGFSG